MNKFDRYIKINKKAWNKKTPVHIKSNFYKNDQFIKVKNSLNAIEINAIGNVNEKSLLHLQCHFGQDSISLARMGAKVTGVDFSEIAIREAIKLSKKINIPVKFCFGQDDSTVVDKLHIKVKICVLQSLDHNLQIILAFASHSN